MARKGDNLAENMSKNVQTKLDVEAIKNSNDVKKALETIVE
jgi:hypothetical protein